MRYVMDASLVMVDVKGERTHLLRLRFDLGEGGVGNASGLTGHFCLRDLFQRLHRLGEECIRGSMVSALDLSWKISAHVSVRAIGMGARSYRRAAY